MARGDNLLRQWNLIMVLQAHHRFGVDADEIATRLDCSKRTVQRDLAVLQDVFPIRCETRERGQRFWRLDRQVIESAQLQLAMTEMLSLFLSQQLLLPLAGTQFGDGLQTVLQKIQGILSERARNYFKGLGDSFLIKSLASHDYSGQDKEIRTLNDAIADGKCVKVTYRSSGKDHDVVSEFHPYGIVLLQASLYCVGHFVSRDSIRTLKVARIKKVTRLNKKFVKPEGFSLADHLDNAFGVFRTDKKLRLLAEFTDWAATNVREMLWHPSQKIVSDTGKKVTATFELGSTIEFKRWILGFGRYAKVTQPKELATEIHEEHLAAAEL